MRLADLVLIVHFMIALFIAGGLLAVAAGAWSRWRWIRDRKFRALHLAAIALVAAESLFGIACPLTVLEDWLRNSSTERGFIARWVTRALYYDLPEAWFTLLYVLIALLTLLLWRVVPPAPRSLSHDGIPKPSPRAETPTELRNGRQDVLPRR